MYKVNLLPDELIQGDGYKKAFLLFLAGLLVAFYVLGYCLLLYESDRMADEKNLLQKRVAEMQPTAFQLEKLQTQKAELEKAASELESLADKRAILSPIIDEINKNIPSGIWLTELKFCNERIEYHQYASGQQKAALNSSSYTVADEPAKKAGDGQRAPDTMPPNAVVILGESKSVLPVSVLAKKLSDAKYFCEVRINDIHENEVKGLYDFSLTAFLYRGGN